MPWIVRGDIDGFFGLALDNLVQLLLIDALCRGVLGFPADRYAAYLIDLGYPADRPLKPLRSPNRRPFSEVVHRGRW